MEKEGFGNKQLERKAPRRRKNMNAVLSIQDHVTRQQKGKLTPRKPFKGLLEFSPAEIRKIQELENRCSGSDEFPLLWDDEEDED